MTLVVQSITKNYSMESIQKELEKILFSIKLLVNLLKVKNFNFENF